MPTYEAAYIFKAVTRPELAAAVKRACTQLLSRGSLIRKMENLGNKELPYTAIRKGERLTHGNYIMIYFDAPVEITKDLQVDSVADRDVLTMGIVRQKEEPPKPCEYGPCHFGELSNPDHDKSAYRKNVIRRYKARK